MKPWQSPGAEPPRRLYWFLHGVITALFWPAFRLLYGFRVTGREHLEGLPAAITVCNHVHTLDCVMTALALGHRRVWFLSLPSNLTMPVAGPIVRVMGGIGVPDGLAGYKALYRRLAGIFARGEWFHVYPEGALQPGCRTLRSFLPGAFQMAVRCGVPVVPCVLRRYPRRWGPDGLEFVLLPPLSPDPALPPRAAADALCKEARRRMEDAIF